MPRLSWMTRTTKEQVLKRANCQRRLLDTLTERKLSFVGEIVRAGELDRALLTGMVYGPRCEVRPKTRNAKDVESFCGELIQNAIRVANSRSEWRDFAKRGATVGRSRPSRC